MPFADGIELADYLDERCQPMKPVLDFDDVAANDVLLTAFLDKPYFRETLTQHIGEEFYKTIRTNAGQRG
jgi:hypothetical protein